MTWKVAIVGSGPAGLTAAKEIRERAEKVVELTIFEAAGRPGGRAWTEKIGDNYMDWGCEAQEGGSKAPGAVLDKESDKAPAPGGGEVRQVLPEAGGWKVIDPECAKKSKVDEEIEKNVDEQLKTILNWLVLASRDDVIPEADLETPCDWIRATVSGFGTFSESCEPYLYSARDRVRSGYLQDALYESGGDRGTFFFKRGMGNAILEWAGKLPIVLDTPIRRITPNPFGKAIVFLESGMTREFDAVIVTVPSSIIASGALVVDTMKGEILDAFRACPLGHYFKMAVTGLSNVKQPPPGDELYAVGPEGKNMFLIRQSLDGKLILVHVAGETAATVKEKWVADAWLKGQLEALNPELDGWSDENSQWVQWSDNPFVLGAYSYCRRERWLERQKLNGLRIDNIWFAGEAHSLIWYGGVDGAMETGRLAALELLHFLDLLKEVPETPWDRDWKELWEKQQKKKGKDQDTGDCS